MKSVEIQPLHTCVGCNRVVGALDWGIGELVAYGAHGAVILYEPQLVRVAATLHGHSGRVNCVKWGPICSDGSELLFSGASDGVVLVWSGTAGEPDSFRKAAEIAAHEGAVTSVQYHWDPSGALMLVTCGADNAVCLWHRVDAAAAEWTLRQSIVLRSSFAHCAAVADIPAGVAGAGGWMLLAIGADRNVQVMVADPGGEFEEKFTLVGHQDWVRAVEFQPAGGKGTDLLLASGAQDRNVRVWRAAVTPDGASAAGEDPVLEELTRLAARHSVAVGSGSLTIALEAVLVGHEDWVHSLRWQPAGPDSGDRPALLTASMDRTMMIWRPDEAETRLWMSEHSLGDAGSSALGYFGGVFSPSGDAVMAHGFSGALHLWRREGPQEWRPRPALGGHSAAVVDCCWILEGQCLMSASADQTVRIATEGTSHWHELARPQVHGHDLSCIAPLPRTDASVTSFRYASGAEEKVLRIFQAPSTFDTSLRLAKGKEIDRTVGNNSVAIGATVAALGLSNKAVYADDELTGTTGDPAGGYDFGPEMAPNPQPQTIQVPAFEEHLSQNTLWPELRKLFGHGNDVICAAADPRGEHLASACRAQNSATASVWVWDTKDWSTVAVLQAHTLTVTALEYSPDGSLLLSASRDRSFTLFRRGGGSQGTGEGYTVLQRCQKAHGRIIWGVSWAACGKVFATCSRDKTVKIWKAPGPTEEAGEESQAVSLICQLHDFSHAVTAVAFLPSSLPDHVFAAGTEAGAISIWSVHAGDGGSQLLWSSSAYHCATVRRLQWQPPGEGEGLEARLASAGDDHKLRVFRVALSAAR